MIKFLGQDNCVMYRPDRFHEGDFTASEHAVSSVVVAPASSLHERVSIWNRGGLAGTITVRRDDGERIAAALLDAPGTGQPSR